MNIREIKIIGVVLLISGLLTALTFGGNRGFSGDVFSGIAYIGGFIVAFIGAYFTFIYGRKVREEE